MVTAHSKLITVCAPAPHLCALLRWWLAVAATDPVRRALNQGVALLCGVFLALSLPLSAVVLLVERLTPARALGLALLPLALLVVWGVNRRRAMAGSISLAALIMIGVGIVVEPESYAQHAFVHALFILAPMAAAAFLGLRAGLAASVAQAALLTGILLHSGAPAPVALAFACYCAADGVMVAVILGFGSALFQDALRQALAANDALQELNTTLEHSVAERTAHLAAALQKVQALLEARASAYLDIAHDLNNHITVISCARGLVHEALCRGDQPEALAQLDALTRATRVLGLFSRELKDAARLEQARLALHPQATDLRALAAEIVEELRGEAAHYAISITIAEQPGLPAAWCDTQRVGRVLRNLLGNALRYTRNAGSAIAIDFASEGDTVRCIVIDSGIGIAPEQLARLSEGFARAGSAAEAPEGTGLGLNFCARLLHASGGALRIGSEGLGRGTTAELALPRAHPCIDTAG